MKLFSYLFVVSLVFMGLFILPGCGGALTSGADPMLSGHVGGMCTVQFQRNALGAAGNPISPTTGNFNGSEVQITGKLLRVNSGWICLGIDQAEYFIPKEVILM